jgi:hypothetical protein
MSVGIGASALVLACLVSTSSPSVDHGRRAPLAILDASMSCPRPHAERCVRRAFDIGARIEMHPCGCARHAPGAPPG